MLGTTENTNHRTIASTPIIIIASNTLLAPIKNSKNAPMINNTIPPQKSGFAKSNAIKLMNVD